MYESVLHLSEQKAGKMDEHKKQIREMVLS